MNVVQATQEAEAGESLEPGRSEERRVGKETVFKPGQQSEAMTQKKKKRPARTA